MRIKFYNTTSFQLGQDIVNNGDQNIKIRFNDDDMDALPFLDIQPELFSDPPLKYSSLIHTKRLDNVNHQTALCLSEENITIISAMYGDAGYHTIFKKLDVFNSYSSMISYISGSGIYWTLST